MVRVPGRRPPAFPVPAVPRLGGQRGVKPPSARRGEGAGRARSSPRAKTTRGFERTWNVRRGLPGRVLRVADLVLFVLERRRFASSRDDGPGPLGLWQGRTGVFVADARGGRGKKSAKREVRRWDDLRSMKINIFFPFLSSPIAAFPAGTAPKAPSFREESLQSRPGFVRFLRRGFPIRASRRTRDLARPARLQTALRSKSFLKRTDKGRRPLLSG